jgi:hypothetical protein
MVKSQPGTISFGNISIGMEEPSGRIVGIITTVLARTGSALIFVYCAGQLMPRLSQMAFGERYALPSSVAATDI